MAFFIFLFFYIFYKAGKRLPIRRGSSLWWLTTSQVGAYATQGRSDGGDGGVFIRLFTPLLTGWSLVDVALERTLVLSWGVLFYAPEPVPAVAVADLA